MARSADRPADDSALLSSSFFYIDFYYPTVIDISPKLQLMKREKKRHFRFTVDSDDSAQCCGAGAGGAGELEPESKSYF